MTLNLSSSVYFEIGDHESYLRAVPERERVQTMAILYEFLDKMSEQDEDITPELRNTIHESAAAAAVKRIRSASVEVSHVTEIVVTLLQVLGKRFHEELSEDEIFLIGSAVAMKDIESNKYGVFSYLRSVIREVLEVNGKLPNISVGRISAIFYYCYFLCKGFAYLQSSRQTVVQFLFSLGMALIVILAEVNFYQWLEHRGGWLSALTTSVPVSSVNSWSLMLLNSLNWWRNNSTILIGIALIGMWAYYKFTRQT